MPPDIDGQRIRQGSHVALREDVYGYREGTRGVIVRSPDLTGRVLVRFEGTGHRLFVTTDVLSLDEEAPEA